jgi:predicted phage terminase large subunit-like protein
MVKREWFRTYLPSELPKRFEQIVQSWDTANKVSQLSDYSVCTTWGVQERRLYLLHVLRKRMEYPELKRAVREQWQTHRATVILIEDKASGTQLIQELVAEGLSAVTSYSPEHDKIMRLYAQTATIENGLVYLPPEAAWLADYLHELTTFPNAKYEDQADSTSQALAWLKQVPPEPGILTYTRFEVARLRHEQGLPFAAAAGGIGATAEELSNWIKESARYSDEMIEAYQSALRPTCSNCGGKLGKTTILQGEFEYHPECQTG